MLSCSPPLQSASMGHSSMLSWSRAAGPGGGGAGGGTEKGTTLRVCALQSYSLLISGARLSSVPKSVAKFHDPATDFLAPAPCVACPVSAAVFMMIRGQYGTSLSWSAGLPPDGHVESLVELAGATEEQSTSTHVAVIPEAEVGMEKGPGREADTPQVDDMPQVGGTGREGDPLRGPSYQPSTKVHKYHQSKKAKNGKGKKRKGKGKNGKGKKKGKGKKGKRGKGKVEERKGEEGEGGQEDEVESAAASPGTSQCEGSS
jgi:hypothetical protein